MRTLADLEGRYVFVPPEEGVSLADLGTSTFPIVDFLNPLQNAAPWPEENAAPFWHIGNPDAPGTPFGDLVRTINPAEVAWHDEGSISLPTMWPATAEGSPGWELPTSFGASDPLFPSARPALSDDSWMMSPLNSGAVQYALPVETDPSDTYRVSAVPLGRDAQGEVYLRPDSGIAARNAVLIRGGNGRIDPEVIALSQERVTSDTAEATTPVGDGSMTVRPTQARRLAMMPNRQMWQKPEGGEGGGGGFAATTEILAPGGKFAGPVRRRIMGVSSNHFQELLSGLRSGASRTEAPVTYPGPAFKRQDGFVFGTRTSKKHGETIDILQSNNPLIPQNFKIHQNAK